MDTRQLARIDLNLLVALQVLLEERNVSKAAERLFVTQSAMSKTLGRLRELLDDPLFTRTSHGMLPTPRAEALQTPLAEVLQSIQSVVAPQEFDPSTFEGEFTIAVAEYLGVLVLPALMEILQREAPHLRIRNISRIEQQLDQLAEGNLDLAIHIERQHYGPDYQVTSLGRMPPTLLARQGHPLRKQELTWENIARYPQVSFYVPDVEELEFMRQENAFQQFDALMEDVFETSHLFTALEVVRRTDCLMPGPPFLASHPQLSAGIMAFPMDAEGVEFSINYMLCSHRRTESSLPHQWLRQKIIDIVEGYKEAQESGDPYRDYQSHTPWVR